MKKKVSLGLSMTKLGLAAEQLVVARKKSALDLLGKIENDFALLRDRFVNLNPPNSLLQLTLCQALH